MKTILFTLLAFIGFTTSAQQMAIADTRPSTPAFKEAYALNLSQVKTEVGYPEICRDAHIEGKVLVQVQVSFQGKYISHRIQKASNKFFRQAVEQQICNLEFSPAYIKGKRTGTWIPLVFEFNLKTSD